MAAHQGGRAILALLRVYWKLRENNFHISVIYKPSSQLQFLIATRELRVCLRFGVIGLRSRLHLVSTRVSG